MTTNIIKDREYPKKITPLKIFEILLIFSIILFLINMNYSTGIFLFIISFITIILYRKYKKNKYAFSI